MSFEISATPARLQAAAGRRKKRGRAPRLTAGQQNSRLSAAARLAWMGVFVLNLFGSQLCWLVQYRIPQLGVLAAGLASGAALVCLAFCLWHFRGWVLVGGGLLAALVMAWFFKTTLEGAAIARQLVVSRLSIAFTGMVRQSPPVGDFSAFAFFGFFVMFYLALLVGFTVLFRRSMLLNLLFTAPFLWLAFAWSFTTPALPTLALFSSWCALLLKGSAGRSKTPPAWLPVAAAALCAAYTGVLLAAVPQAAYQKNPDVVALRHTFADMARESGFGQALGLGQNQIGLRGRPQINLAGESYLDYSDGTAFQVKAEGLVEGDYLRGFSCDVYDGSRWHQGGNYDFALAESWQPLTYTNDTQVSLEELGMLGKASFRYDSPTAYIHTPYQTSSLFWPDADGAEIFRRDAYIQPPEGGTSYTAGFTIDYSERYLQQALQHFPNIDDSFSMYTIETSPEAARMVEEATDENGEIQFSDALISRLVASGYLDVVEFPVYRRQAATPQEEEYIEYIGEVYTQLPDGVAGRLLPIAQQAGIAPVQNYQDWYYTALMVAEYIKETGHYTRSPGGVPADIDFTEYFLTQSRAGYCVHFATAGAVLLRALGVPARYAEGFIMPSPQPGAAWTDVPDKNAHAWVEVWLPGAGWMPVEMTPGGSDAAREATGLPSRDPALDNLPTPSPSPGGGAAEEELMQPGNTRDDPAGTSQPSAASPQHQGGAGGGGGTGPGGLAPWMKNSLWILGGLGLLALGVWLVPWALRRRRRRRFAAPGTNTAALYLYTYLQALARFGPQPSAGATALAGKARFSQHTLTEAERRTLAEEAAATRALLQTRLSFVRRLLLYLRGL